MAILFFMFFCNRNRGNWSKNATLLTAFLNMQLFLAAFLNLQLFLTAFLKMPHFLLK